MPKLSCEFGSTYYRIIMRKRVAQKLLRVFRIFSRVGLMRVPNQVEVVTRDKELARILPFQFEESSIALDRFTQKGTFAVVGEGHLKTEECNIWGKTALHRGNAALLVNRDADLSDT